MRLLRILDRGVVIQLKKVMTAAYGVAALAGGASAYAQAGNQPTEPALQLKEVIVTAQRTQSNEQKTPISMQVYSHQDLVNRGAINLQSLANTDPSITFAYSTGEPYIAMRGVATGNVTDTGDPSVAVETDGIFLNRSYSLESNMYDIARVEVLRGPQGTLYGRNADGGVISIITAHPVHRFDSRASVEVGNYGTLNTEGMLNLPLSHALAVRFAAASFFHNGYRNNAPSRTNGDDMNSRSGRMEVAFAPGAGFHGWLSYSYTSETDAGQAAELIPFDGPNHTATHLYQNPNPYTFPIYAPHFNDLTVKDLKWSLAQGHLPGGVTVTLLGGWNSTAWHHAQPSIATPANGWEPGGQSKYASYFQNEFPITQSDELRFTSRQHQRLTWQTGVYYFEDKSQVFSHFVDNYGTQYQDNNITTFVFPRDESTSKAVYGQFTFAITPTVSFIGGGRYTKDYIVRVGTFDAYRTTPSGAHILIKPNVNGEASSNKVTYLADVNWQVTPQSMLYGKVSTGYKAGGFTGAGSYKPESLISYEIGSKNRMLNDTTQLNGDAYYMNYTNQQLNQFTDPLAGAQTVNANSKIYGVEASLKSLMGRVGELEIDADYLHARVEGFTPPPGYNPAVSEPIIGNQLPLSPPVSVSAQFQHSWDGILSGVVTGLVSAKYEDARYFSANDFASTRAPSDTTENVALTYRRDEANWSAMLYCRNISNQPVLIDAEEVYTTGAYQYDWAPPRTFGVRITASFR
jgi:iron complex outermembrane receptor protein